MNQGTSFNRRRTVLLNTAFFICAAFLLFILAMFCFYRLGDKPIYDHDEARHGVSAYEMIQSGDWIVTTYKESPDYWNLKPPLSEWIICAFFAILGFTKTAFRAYAAVSIFLCVLMVFLWSWKRIGKAGALFTVLAMLAIDFLWMYHCARAGDANALFLFLCTISTISLAEAFNRNPRFLILSCFSASLAFLTKGFHAVIPMIELFAALLILRKQIHISRATVLLSLAALVLPAGIWALLRYQQDGMAFLQEMLFTDVLNRSANAIEGHVGGPTFYVDFLLSEFGIIACLAAIPVGLAGMKKLSSDTIILALSVLIPLFVFSIAKTKLEWYIYTVYPGVALLGGYGIQKIADSEQKLYLKALALCIPIFIAALATYQTAYGIIIYPVKQSAVQTALENCLSREDETSSRTIYLDVSDDESETWTQALYLTIQLAGDCHAGDGSVEDWKEDANALLFTKEDSQSVTEGEIIRSYEEYRLIAHSNPA